MRAAVWARATTKKKREIKQALAPGGAAPAPAPAKTAALE